MAPCDSVQANITGFWGAVAAGYEAHGGNVPEQGSAEFHAWVDALSELLPPTPADVLDVATGTGFAALIAARLGHRVTAIDLAEPMLAEAQRAAALQGVAVRFERRDAVATGLPPQTQDAIICRHLLWTLREPEVALAHWRELLKPGGRVIAIDGFWFRDELPDEAAEPGEVGLFERYYDRETRAALPTMQLERPAQVASLFERSGFVHVEISNLAAVHALAKDPPSAEPWYVILART